MEIKPEITTGNLITAALSAVAVSFLVWAAFCRRWPLKMTFDTQPFVAQGERLLHMRARIEIGRSKLHIVLKPRILVNVASLDVRFVKRAFPGWEDAWHRHIKIVSVAVPQWDNEAETQRTFVGPNTVTKRQNSVGGWIISPVRRKLWTAGDELYLEIEVEAKTSWSGYLSILCRGDRRTYCRRVVKVRAPREVPGT